MFHGPFYRLFLIVNYSLEVRYLPFKSTDLLLVFQFMDPATPLGEMGFKGFRQWEDLLRIDDRSRGPIAIQSRMSRWIPELETACFTEENALSARKHDLFSVL